MVRLIRVPPPSPFLEEACALCKQPFAPGDEVVVCPMDEARHHVQCWQANQNRCSALGCNGRGEVEPETAVPPTPSSQPPPGDARVVTVQSPGQRSKVITMPSTQYGCSYTCLLLSIAIAILLFSVGCFGLWLIADYVVGCGLHMDYGGLSCPPTATPTLMPGLLFPFGLLW